ncbi:MAG: polyphenol oxidase family protein, partial [Gemmatimonadaceae bacterium]
MTWLEDPAQAEPAPGFAELGLLAFTTTRHAGSFGLDSLESSSVVFGRWLQLSAALRDRTARLVFAHQVHGTNVVEHRPGWSGLLRVPDADGHLAAAASTAMAVTLADCIPVFIAHPSGAAAILHSGWKGTAGAITRRAIARFAALGLRPPDLMVHCGPGICGRCYEVSPDVFRAVTGRSVDHPTPVDLRAIIASDARATGVKKVSISAVCTRCNNDRF